MIITAITDLDLSVTVTLVVNCENSKLAPNGTNLGLLEQFLEILDLRA